MAFLGKIFRFKNLITKILILLTSTIYLQSGQAQIFNADQSPPSLKWRQINTRKFQIIYPEEFESEAQRMANTLEAIISRVSSSLRKEPRKISIILQNQGTSSNGFVQLAPRRSEFFTTPSQNFDYQNWLNSLAVHELRHVVQFDKLTGSFNYPPLETLALAFFGISLPPWFYEGDAVTIETALTDAGRGRQPEWPIAIRTNTLSGKKFSYSKDYFGSLKDYTPGYYQLGFFMNSTLRRDQGKFILDSIFNRIKSFPFRPYNLSNSLRKFTGMNTKTLHDSTISKLETLWQNQLEKSKTIKYQPINIRHDKIPENFLLPTSIEGEKILFIKESKAENPSLFTLDKEGEIEKIKMIGYQETPWFSYASNKIVWDEFRFDKRFHKRSYNVINLYDLKSKKSRQITHRSRLFAPALSPDGSLIIAVDVSPSNIISLVEIDARTGKELNRHRSPENYMLQMPSFDQSGQKIVVAAVATTGKSLYELDRKSGKFTLLFPFQLQEINRPIYAEGEIIFKAHFNGIDNIYRFSPKDKQIYQLTYAEFGAYNPYFDSLNNRILFNNYGLKGHDITSIIWPPLNSTPLVEIENNFVDYAAPLGQQEGNDNVFDSIPVEKYESKRYREIEHLFYFHSLLGVSDENATGVQLQSDNKLNTMSFYTAYQFNSTLGRSEYKAGFEYKRFFPIFSVNYTNRPGLINRRQIINNRTVLSPVAWRENEIKIETTVPFTLNRFNSNYSLGLKAGTSYLNRYDIDKPFKNLPDKVIFPLHYQFYVSRNDRRSPRDLAPKWGQNVSLTYRHFPFENLLQGDLFTFKSRFYFPGLLRNHSLQFSFNWQSNSGDYNNFIDIPRVSGYSYMRTAANPSNTLFLNYRFPLFYPDWEIGPLAYIKRIKGGFFADFQDIRAKQFGAPRSFGAELRSDMNLLRFYLPNFDLGGKIIFINEKPRQNPIFEFIVGYNL